MVSEIFPGVCSAGHNFYPGAEAALYCGCHCGAGSGRRFLEILPERTAAQLGIPDF